jgi:hypothetical protein
LGDGALSAQRLGADAAGYATAPERAAGVVLHWQPRFDPVNVGVVTKAHDKDACAPGLTDFDVSLLGNSNRGHSFEGKETDVTTLPPGVIGPALSNDERQSLVEYLKTL